jgi:HD-like signal output (HDOD) protein
VQVVEDSLKSAEQRNKAIPRLPTVVPQLLKSLRDPKASADSFVDIIRQDPVIASAVLKMANSAYFNPTRTRIDSFQRAVTTLGIQGLRSILSSAVMQPIIQCKSPFFIHFGKKLWDHSLCCAVSCQVIATQEGHEPFKAYLTGLIHDIGKITVFTQLTQQLKLNPDEKKPPAHVFVHLMEKFSAELSYWIAKDWGFPDDIVNAIKAQIGVKDPSQLAGMGSMLYRANQASVAYMLMNQHVLTESQAQMLLMKAKLPDDLFAQLDTVYTETA